VAEERVVLEHKADLTFAGGDIRNVFAVERNLAAARIGLLEAGDDAEQRGLAGAGGAEERDELAGGHVEIDAVERREGAEGFAKVGNVDAHAGDGFRWRAPGRGAIRRWI